jgi:hypothetical protein
MIQLTHKAGTPIGAPAQRHTLRDSTTEARRRSLWGTSFTCVLRGRVSKVTSFIHRMLRVTCRGHSPTLGLARRLSCSGRHSWATALAAVRDGCVREITDGFGGALQLLSGISSNGDSLLLQAVDRCMQREITLAQLSGDGLWRGIAQHQHLWNLDGQVTLDSDQKEKKTGSKKEDGK